MQWNSVKENRPASSKCLAVSMTEKGKMYNMRHDGWFRDTIYSCRYEDGKFIIESHGPEFQPTHWMPLPELPKEDEKMKIIDCIDKKEKLNEE